MFSMTNIMDPFGQRDHHTAVPFFVDFGSQPTGCPRARGSPCHFQNRRHCNPCEIPDMQYSGRMFSPIASALQQIFVDGCEGKPKAQENKKEKGSATTEKKTTPRSERMSSKSGSLPQADVGTGSQKGTDPSPKPTFQDIINHAMSTLSGWKEAGNVRKWTQQIDCRGFASNNIKVKVDGNELLLKAFRKLASDGGVRTMSMRKSVPLPKNIDTKSIKCKLSPNGIVIIEAPYLDNENQENPLDIVKEVVTAMIPELHQVFRPSGCNTETPTEESCSCELRKERCEAEKETKQKDMESPNVDEQNGQSEQPNSEKREPTSDTHDGHSKMDGHENVSSDETVPLLSNKNNESNEDTPMPIDEGDQVPEKNGNEHMVDRDEIDSNSTEDSFVLLSELEKENSAVDNTPPCVGDIPVMNEEYIDDDNHTPAGNNNDEQLKEAGHGDIDVETLNEQSIASDSHDITTEKDSIQSNESDKVLFRLEMPSYNPESMNVTFDNTNRLLSISASKEQAGHRDGVPADTITRSVTVGDDVDVSKLQCFFRDGTLIVKAPLRSTVTVIPIKS